MNYTFIDRSDAPARAPERARRRVEGMDELIAALEPGKVARIEMSENEKPRGVADQVYKTATRSGMLVDVWDVGGILYVEPASA
jgi:hypothetical protein